MPTSHLNFAPFEWFFLWFQSNRVLVLGYWSLRIHISDIATFTFRTRRKNSEICSFPQGGEKKRKVTLTLQTWKERAELLECPGEALSRRLLIHTLNFSWRRRHLLQQLHYGPPSCLHLPSSPRLATKKKRCFCGNHAHSTCPTNHATVLGQHTRKCFSFSVVRRK